MTTISYTELCNATINVESTIFYYTASQSIYSRMLISSTSKNNVALGGIVQMVKENYHIKINLFISISMSTIYQHQGWDDRSCSNRYGIWVWYLTIIPRTHVGYEVIENQWGYGFCFIEAKILSNRVEDTHNVF